jgi:hypothetical protein
MSETGNGASTPLRQAIDVHSAFDRFMRTDDFLEGKRVLEELKETLLSDEGLAYLQRQLEHAEPDTPLAQVLGIKGRMLIDCRRMSIGYAFARMFLELNPEPISAETAQAIAATATPDGLTALAQRDSQTLAEVRHVVVATRLQNDLQDELMGVAYPSGGTRRVEACRLMTRLCDRRVDPETWVLIAGELANAISAVGELSTEAIDECIGLYESVLADAPAGRADVIAQAHHGLGQMHAYKIDARGEPDREVEQTRHHFAQALRLRPRERMPAQWAQTQHALGRALLAAAAGDGDRARAALGPLRAALEVYAEQGGPEAAWADAQQALEATYLTIGNSEAGGGAERLAPTFDGWPCALADRVETAGYARDDWLPAGQSLELWGELLTMERYRLAADMPFPGFLAARRRDVGGRVTDGELRWETLTESASDIVYRWSVSRDFAIEDQECLGRVFRHKADLYATRFVARRLLTPNERKAWLEHLASLAPLGVGVQTPATTRVLSVEEAKSRLQSLTSVAGDPIADANAFARSYVDGVSRSRMSELYVSILILASLRLLAARDGPADALPVAIATLRRAIETAGLRSELGARAVAALAKCYLQQAAAHDETAARRARLAFEKAAEVFSQLGRVPDVGAALYGIGNCERLAAKTPSELVGVLGWYGRALERQPEDGDPLGWADTTLAIGEVCAEIYGLNREVAAREQAEAAYERVLAALASKPAFSDLGTGGGAEVMCRAVAGLQQLDFAELPKPNLPPGYLDRKTRGNLLFLRPLTTARGIPLENRFAHPEHFAVRFDTEPKLITLEVALYRVLAEHLSFWSIAGHPEGAGASRMFVLGGEGWRDVALGQFDRADLILLLPSDSAGVRWEIETIRDKALLAKVLFVMPPRSPSYDVEGQWNGARRLLSEQGIEAPAWTPQGLFFAIGADGKCDWTLRFDALWENALYHGIAQRFGLAPLEETIGMDSA